MISHFEYDIVIVGSGPAGVSAAFPVVEAGLKVLMVDGGNSIKNNPPGGNFFDLRRSDPSQWKWILGENFYALRQTDINSPKFRVPLYENVFKDFLKTNSISTKNFMGIGSLAPGGLSNAWGCGVACFTEKEFVDFPFSLEEMRASYKRIIQRIGVSGAVVDDLSDFFGVDEYAQPPILMDDLQQEILAKYEKLKNIKYKNNFYLGRSRVAALSNSLKDRDGCNQCGNCLWGCARGSLYSAIQDLNNLRRHPNFNYLPGFLVKNVTTEDSFVVVKGIGASGKNAFRARRVFMAAGTLASTRLALSAIDFRRPISIQSCPTAGFLLWRPRSLGRKNVSTFGLGQLSFSQNLSNGVSSFGSLFSASGLPFSEFTKYMPIGRRNAIDMLKFLLPSCMAGNVFLPGSLSATTLQLDQNNDLNVNGQYKKEVKILMRESQRKLGLIFYRLGAIMLPGSFKIGAPGADIHYSSSLPMRVNPELGETNRFGQLQGASRIHIVDGASLSSLPSKSHTLTIMANADRIARHVVGLRNEI